MLQTEIPGSTPIPPGTKNTTTGDGCITIIHSDIFEALPKFYRAAIKVLERNGYCSIQEI